MVLGLVIPAEASAPIESRDLDHLKDYQAAVGGLIEPVDIPALGITVYVNEEGLLRQLPLNSRATFMWWYHVPTSRHYAMLVGDAVVVGRANQSGVDTDVPADVIELFQLDARFAIEARPLTGKRWNRDERTYGYVDVVVWAMLMVERSAGQLEVRIVPVS